ncbi:hypothetical protein GGS20DRAFT_583671 [Poronia punctata]|nr:hypothetical protein GGS20DRAFT_583671 [Poronia punctata]
MENRSGLAIRGAEESTSHAKRRKVRKGTRSCWECRRRKIRCVYASDNAEICAGCDTRGTNCVSQEFPDGQTQIQDRRVTQRLGRVEEMLEKLVEKIMPDSYNVRPRIPTNNSTSSTASPADGGPGSVEDEDEGEDQCPFAVGKPPIFEVFSSLHDTAPETNLTEGRYIGGIPTPASSACEGALTTKYASISKKLHGLFPCQQDVDAIVAASPSPTFVLGFFSRYHDLVEGATEEPSSIAVIPPPTSHPAVLAKRLMQLMNCLQQIQPTTPLKLVSSESTGCIMAKAVSEATLAVQNDDVVGYVEGIETLALITLYHSNVGNLRKAWLTLRRAISVAQLMGVDRGSDKPLQSADPKSNPSTRTKAKPLWFRLNFVDRYLSLLLGLPAATDDNSFLSDTAADEPTDRLEKQHTVVMGAIIKRNSSQKGDPALGTTQTIDCELEAASRSVKADFWQHPSLEKIKAAGPLERMQYMTQLMLQMNHHNLLILLHLPFLLRDPKERRWDYSKDTCTSSSRQLLHTFLLFRKVSEATFACRHTDYGALTAAMTLLLGYLDPKLQARDAPTLSRREADRRLVEETRDTLRRMAKDTGDKLSRDASCIINRLLPLLDPDLLAGTGTHEGVVGEVPTIHLDIPYLGTININSSSNNSHTSTSRQEVPHAHAFPIANNTNTSPGTSTTTSSSRIDLDPHFINTHPQHTSTDWNNTPPALSPRQQQQQHSTEFSYLLSIPMDYHPNDFNNNVDYTNNHDFAPTTTTTTTTMQFEWSQAQLAHPELAAEADKWTFQGFDTAYFESLFSSGFQGQGS